jgi:hypothetical protein
VAATLPDARSVGSAAILDRHLADVEIGRPRFRFCRERLKGDDVTAPHVVELCFVADLDIVVASMSKPLAKTCMITFRTTH